MAIKKNDTVKVLTGKDKGKTGVVIEVLPKKGKVLVKGIAEAVCHKKARKQCQNCGIISEDFRER